MAARSRALASPLFLCEKSRLCYVGGAETIIFIAHVLALHSFRCNKVRALAKLAILII